MKSASKIVKSVFLLSIVVSLPLVYFLLTMPEGRVLSISTQLAHSGRTDQFGGHNCSAKSIQKGLCSGYHYHNGGDISLESEPYTTRTVIPAITPIKSPVSVALPVTATQTSSLEETEDSPLTKIATIGVVVLVGYWLSNRTKKSKK